MKRILVVLAGLGWLSFQMAAQNPVALKDDRDKASYSIGASIGNNLKGQGLDLNPEVVAAGLKAVLAGEKTLLSQQEMKEALTAFEKEMMGKQMEVAEKNRKAGEAFLEANKKQQGVQTLANGLQYKVITPGTGAKPKATDTVTTHYRGTLIDGTEFDSSYERGEPASFALNQVIRGWTEALQLMSTGSKWQLFIPSDLAYGESGRPPVIPPNSTLVFEIELLSIN